LARWKSLVTGGEIKRDIGLELLSGLGVNPWRPPPKPESKFEAVAFSFVTSF
jgi:hypothetical protein